MEKLTYTVMELKDVLGLGRDATYKLVRRSDFPKIKVGKSFIIPKDALYEWIIKNTN